MRISDWSSDVCSSDLYGMGHRLGAKAGGDPLSVGVHRKPARADLLSPLWFRRCRPQPLSLRRPYRRGPHLEARPVTRPSALPPFPPAPSLAGVAPASIAPASWRERVSQYV